MIVHDSIFSWAASYDGPPFHSMLCDPPYHLTSITKRFGKATSAQAQGGVYARQAKGFMGRTWDGGDVAFQADTWATLGQHLYPGAFGMACAGSRGWHRMACAMEDAGLIIHPTIFCWAYSSGFPKATRIDTQLDRSAGAPWEGYRYGLQALKPAVEPIIVFQRPYAGRPVASIATTGAGALNIKGGSIPTVDTVRTYGIHRGDDPVTSFLTGANQPFDASDRSERWPANLALCHHPACTDARCHLDCTVQAMAIQHGDGELSGGSSAGHMQQHMAYADTGTVARYFYQADWTLDRLEAADLVGYYAKASTSEREAGLDPLLCRLMEGDTFGESTVADGRKTPINNPYQRGTTPRRNIHPTIKPLSLMRWLATLLLPPAPYAPRRLLVPFAGTGSEMIGARLAGWDEVLGIELEADHVAIAKARIAYWEQQRHRFMHGQPITVRIDRTNAPTLFDEEVMT